MTERHHYKYIVLDSSKENGNAVQAKFNVQIPHGITNASRVCVKSFSMPNVIHNVYGGFKNVRFVEFYRPTAGGNWVYDIYNFTLPDGYDETADLITTLQAKFTNTSGNATTLLRWALPPQKYILLTFCFQDDGSSRFLELVT